MRLNHDRCPQFFSIDVKSLFYSLPHHESLLCTENAIDECGVVNFQDKTRLSCGHFLELLKCYCNFYFTGRCPVATKKGYIYIGSSIAPHLNDLFLGHLGKKLPEVLLGTSAAKAFRFVDDFMFFVDCRVDQCEAEVHTLLPNIQDSLKPLDITHELHQDGT